MSAKRKTVTMTLTVSVPAGLTAAQARREVRTRVQEVNGYYEAYRLGLPDSAENAHGHLDVKVRGLKPGAK